MICLFHYMTLHYIIVCQGPRPSLPQGRREEGQGGQRRGKGAPQQENMSRNGISFYFSLKQMPDEG